LSVLLVLLMSAKLWVSAYHAKPTPYRIEGDSSIKLVTA
jgi:hypothetical protein